MADPADPEQLMPVFALPGASMVELSRFPMPLSQNAAYANRRPIQGRRLPGRTKTNEYRAYELACTSWALAYATPLRFAHALAQQCKGKMALNIDTAFFFQASRIFTLKGEPKILDTANRLKVLHDVLAKLLRIDDKLFWSGTFTKYPVYDPKKGDWVDIELSLVNLDRLNP